MKRDFVFVWGADVQPAIAELSAPKIAQLRARCDERIARAEAYRQDPMLLIYAAETPHYLGEDPPWAPFQQFGYWFKLDYLEERRQYVLNFAQPPGSGSLHADSERRVPRRVRTARAARRPSRRRNGDANKRSAAALVLARATEAAVILRGAGLCSARWARGVLCKIIWHTRASARNSIRVLCDMSSRAASIPHRVWVSSRSKLITGRWGPEARLEPRLLGQDTGLPMLLYTLVWSEEPIDWSANLFGELLPESEQFLR